MASELGSLAAIFLSGEAAWQIAADGKCASRSSLWCGGLAAIWIRGWFSSTDGHVFIGKEQGQFPGCLALFQLIFPSLPCLKGTYLF
jgi:hypothetical protein